MMFGCVGARRRRAVVLAGFAGAAATVLVSLASPAEAADFARKSFEQGTATFEKLVGAKSLDKAIEIHTDYLKTSYEGFVAQSTKITELYANVAKEAFKPLEGIVAKTAR